MTPDTVHLIAQEIRHKRAALTTHETWLQRQPRTETTAEGFRRITFWRRVLKHAEDRLAVGELGEGSESALVGVGSTT